MLIRNNPLIRKYPDVRKNYYRGFNFGSTQGVLPLRLSWPVTLTWHGLVGLLLNS